MPPVTYNGESRYNKHMNDELTALLSQPAVKIAPRLLGCLLERTLDNTVIRLKIVETEAYDQTDAASHSYKGRTPRTDSMFGPPGFLYVYFTYGMHYCCNVVTGPPGQGAAVLIRAVEPLKGFDILSENRGDKQGVELTNGPAKLCQSLRIDKTQNGHDLREAPIRLVIKPPIAASTIIQTPRIGISQSKDLPWRFFIRDNIYVSNR
jgi:DNA-3-methyladenine glycosylase